MAKRRKTNYPVKTKIGQEVRMKGVLRYKEPLKITGKFEGTIETTSFLLIEEGADIKADIKAGTIVIGGTVTGQIEAKEKVLFLETGQLFGNVITGSVQMMEGSNLLGRVEMLRDTSGINIFDSDAVRLKQSVKRL